MHPMRRLALSALSVFLLLAGTADAAVVTLHNKTDHQLRVSGVVRGTQVTKAADPHSTIRIADVVSHTCASVHLPGHHGTYGPVCQQTPAPVDFWCNLPTQTFGCGFAAGASSSELVVTAHQRA